MEDVIIRIRSDNTWCEIRKGKKLIAPALSYLTIIWKQGQFRKESMQSRKSVIWGNLFLTGHLRKVEEFCEFKNFTLKFIDDRNRDYLDSWVKPGKLPRVLLEGRYGGLRPDQESLIEESLIPKRGVVKAPTGTGKTVLELSTLIRLPNKKSLILAHTKDIVKQIYDALIEADFPDVYMIMGGKERDITHLITVSVIHSFSRIPVEEYRDKFDIVMIDEAHHVSSIGQWRDTDMGKKFIESMYAKVLMNINAPIILGYTATKPSDEEAKWAMEGLIGPIIGEQTIQEGIELGLIAKPKIRIERLPIDRYVSGISRYADVYEQGVVQNKALNRTIAKIAMEYAAEGKSSLIMVTRVEHGKNIKAMADNVYNYAIDYVHGNTDIEIRDELKKLLASKQIMSVICTVASGGVWREGVNIPTLDVVINASGGESELGLIQSIGRGMRTTENKTEVIIVDFLDVSHYYLIKHFGSRMVVYSQLGWI